MIITHNLSAMQTNRNLQLNNRNMSKSLEKLSSGYRINVGADDPSGLIISEQLRSQISGIKRAIQNTSEASNLIGVSENALSEINEILKKMRQLAIHACNSGVTSPEQVTANQQEVDSGIDTIQRIANTTRYSDQYLLNGSKQLTYDRTTQVKTTMDHTLIDVEGSRVDQIFKRAGVSMAFTHAGLSSEGYVNNATAAKCAYFEVDDVSPDPDNAGQWIKSEAQVDDKGSLTADQEFVLSGVKGTKLFKFTAGDTLGAMAQSINNSRGATGVSAVLTFSADAQIDLTTNSTYTHSYLDYTNQGFAIDLTGVTGGDFSGGIAATPGLYMPDTDPTANPVQHDGAVTFTGTLLNPNDLAKRLGAASPDAANGDDAASSSDIYITMVQGSKKGDAWTISVGTADGDNDLGEMTFNPESDPSVKFSSGPLAGLTLDLGKAVSYQDSAGPYKLTIPAADITWDGTTGYNVKNNAVVNDFRAQGEVQIYGANINGGAEKMKVTGVSVRNADDFRVGMNTDGDGRVYAKVTKFINDKNYEVQWFKDAECTMLIGTSPNPNVFSATNNSGISNAGLTIALTNKAEVGDVYTVGLVGQEFLAARDSDGIGGVDQPADFNVTGLGGWQGMSESSLSSAVMSGVQLGYNTSETGDLFFKAEGPPEARVISVYTSDKMTPASLVATGTVNLSATGQRVARLEEVTMENGKKSGLNITLPFSDIVTSNGTETGQITFTNVALRIYAEDYGSENYVNLQNKSGNLFHEYRYADSLERTYVREGTTVRNYGQDATLSLNGFPIKANGVLAKVTTADFSGAMLLNAGILGQTTVGTAGYGVGSLYSRAGTMQGINEDEKKMRSNSMNQGYTIIPQTTIVGNSKGYIDGLASEGVANTGSLTLDFSQIDTSKLNTTELAQLEAAMNGGLRIEVKPGTDPEKEVQLALYFTDKAGATKIIDVGATKGLAANSSAIEADTSNLADVLFTDLNSVDGFSLAEIANGTHADLDTNGYNFLAGLVIRGNDLTSSEDVSSAPRTSYAVNTAIEPPTFEALAEVYTYATHARHNTTETLDNFLGGMQFQLGGNEGDQDRTVYSIPSMVMANVGRIEIDGRIYTLQDVLGSSDASLINDPILAMQIITQAIDDVSTLRGRLGAFQANTLETNENSLTIAVEMLQKTESAIRDVDMASESTEFTKNQILVQAGTAMLAQANQISQNVLQLLG